MPLVRAILVCLLGTLIIAAANSCLIAAAIPAFADSCCEQATGSANETAPCGRQACVPCITLDNGVNLSAYAPVTAPAPTISDDLVFTEMLKVRMAQAVQAAEILWAAEPERRPAGPWCVVVKTALPVRGPSHLS
jgi:hypothetical protein